MLCLIVPLLCSEEAQIYLLAGSTQRGLSTQQIPAGRDGHAVEVSYYHSCASLVNPDGPVDALGSQGSHVLS